MQWQGVMPSLVTYAVLISACEKCMKPGLALQAFKAMQQQGVVPDVMIYSAAISVCSKGKQSAGAL